MAGFDAYDVRMSDISNQETFLRPDSSLHSGGIKK
jgi:hypothetical protein